MMVTEQDKTVELLKIAIRMEIDGQKFYLKASQKSNNELGKELLQALAAAEDSHRRKFSEIYDAIRDKKAWPVSVSPPGRGENLRTLFARATEEMSSKVKVLGTELDAVQTALAMENKSCDFYENQSKKATFDAERSFYQSLAAEERGHHLILLDYYEYLKDPPGYFVRKEHPSLDGG